MKRREKLIRNLLLTVLALIGAWFLLGRPLPLKLDYRRAEQAHFLEEKEILQVQWTDGRVLSRDAENLYLFQQQGYFVSNHSIQQFPLEDGFGCAMAVNRALARPMDFYAYDTTGEAAMAYLHYAITPDGAEEPEFVYDIGVQGANGLFRFCLTLEPTEDGGYSGREQDYVTDVYEIWQGYRTHSAYDFTITFCDGQGTVIGQLDDSYEGEDSE